MDTNHMTNSLDPSHMDLSHKIQVAGKHGYFNSKFILNHT